MMTNEKWKTVSLEIKDAIYYHNFFEFLKLLSAKKYDKDILGELLVIAARIGNFLVVKYLVEEKKAGVNYDRGFPVWAASSFERWQIRFLSISNIIIVRFSRDFYK